MEVKVWETDTSAGNQTIVYDPVSKNYFLVTSISVKGVMNKTFVVVCNENGAVKDWNEVFTIVPSNHDKVVKMLQSKTLTANDFNLYYEIIEKK